MSTTLSAVTRLAAQAKAVSDLNYIFGQLQSGGRAVLQAEAILVELDGDELELNLDQAIDYIEALVEKYAK